MPERQAQDIAVDEFRKILLWPFQLTHAAGVESAAIRSQCRAAVDTLTASGLWRPTPDALRHLCPEREHATVAEYQEFVYFHPFVRRFLYGHDGESPIDLLHRTDIKAVRLELDNGVTGPFAVTLSVERLNLYVLSCGIALLALEVAAGSARDGRMPAPVDTPHGPRALSLAHAQVILERFRRAYPPYWDEGQAGLCPAMVGWITESGEQWHCMPDAATCTDYVEQNRQPPLAGHWRALLAPLTFAGDADARWRQVVDERIPALAYVAVADPRCISDGDWVRLALLDEAGTEPLPYAAAFLADFEKNHCHDSFWDRKAQYRTTRYLMSGHGFMAVGATASPIFAEHVVEHIRRHYFQLGLIAHIQSAALLTLSDRLAQAIERRDDPQLAEDILDAVIDFTHRYWFPQVSGHVQARALYGRWRQHLGVDDLHTEVMAEAQTLTAFLNGRAERRRAEEAQRLNRIAAVGLVLTTATGFLGMNVLVEDWKAGGGWVVAATVVATAAVFWGALAVIGYWQGRRR